MSTVELIVPPASEPVTLAEAKEHLRVDLIEEDALIGGLIAAARRHAEGFTRLRFLPQTVKITYTGNPGYLPLPVHPATAITAIEYKQQSDGALTALDPALYQLVKSSVPRCIVPAYNATWPIARDDFDNWEVTVTCSMAATAADLPQDILHAIKLLIGHFYENREDEIAGTIMSKAKTGAHRLLQPHAFHF